MTARISRCLSAAGIRFLGILSRPGLPPLLRSAYRATGGADPSGVPCSARVRHGRGRGRVAGARYRAPAPSEPDKPVFRASRLKQAPKAHGQAEEPFPRA